MPSVAISVIMTMNMFLDPPFCFYCKVKRLQVEIYLDSKESCLHDNALRIQRFADSKLPLSILD